MEDAGSATGYHLLQPLALHDFGDFSGIYLLGSGLPPSSASPGGHETDLEEAVAGPSRQVQDPNSVLALRQAIDPYYEFEKMRIRCDKLLAMSHLPEEEKYKEGKIQSAYTVKEIEQKICFTDTYVHMSIFNLEASVEMRDNISISGCPIAVHNKELILGVNVQASAFGVVPYSTKLADSQVICPGLILIPANYSKYFAAVAVLKGIVAQYDPEVRMGLSDATFSLTEYLQTEEAQRDRLTPFQVIQKIRTLFFKETHLVTVAGCGHTAMIAKLKNLSKQQGIQTIARDQDAVTKFLKGLTFSELCGVSRKTRFLFHRLNVTTTEMLWERRAMLYYLVSLNTFRRIIAICLGYNSDDYHEETYDGSKQFVVYEYFYGTADMQILSGVLASLCIRMQEKLKANNEGGKQVVVEIHSVSREIVRKLYQHDNLISRAGSFMYVIHKVLLRLLEECPGLLINFMKIAVSDISEISPTDIVDDVLRDPVQAPEGGEVMEVEMEVGSEIFERSSPKCFLAKADSTSSIVARNPSLNQLLDRGDPLRQKIYRSNGPPNVVITKAEDRPTLQCPVCKIGLESDYVELGEALMDKHVNKCLLKKFPQMF